MAGIREKGSASVAYRVEAEALKTFKELMPSHIRLTYIYQQLFEVVMHDTEFQDEIAERTKDYIVPSGAGYVSLNISTLPVKKRLEINRALWKILKNRVAKFRRPKDIGMAGIVSIAVGLFADGTFELPLD